jgi:hypothetical protein
MSALLRCVLLLALVAMVMSIPALKSPRKRRKEKLSGYNLFSTTGNAQIQLVPQNAVLTHYVIDSQLSVSPTKAAAARLAGTNIPKVNFEASYNSYKTAVANYYTTLPASCC